MLLSRFSNRMAGLRPGAIRPFFRWLISPKVEACVPESGAGQWHDCSTRFYAALAALPDSARHIYLAHSRDNLPYSAIALQMGIAVEEVEQELAYALNLLAAALYDT